MPHLDEGTLQAWLDRSRSGLHADELDEIESHLATCPECSRRLHELEEVGRRAASILGSVEPEDQTIPDFEAVVDRSRSARRPPSRSPWLTATWAASLVAALGAGWLTNELSRDGGISTSPPGEFEAASPATRVPAESPEEARRESSTPGAAAPGPVPQAGDGAAPEVGRAADDAVASPTTPPPSRAPVESLSQDAAFEAPTALEVEETPRPEARQQITGGDVDVEAPRAAFEAQPAPTRSAGRAVDVPGAAADDSRVVTGRVTDEGGRPVASAQVYLTGSGAGTLTDEDGTFALTVPVGVEADDGEMDLAVERIGYAPATVSLAADAGERIFADIRLGHEALALDEVVVAGAGGEAPTWVPVGRDRAEEVGEFSLLLVPDLEILEIEALADPAGPVIRIRQAVDPETVLTLVESRGPAPGSLSAFSIPEDSALTMAGTRRGEIWITGSASVPPDSLTALVESVR